MAHIHNILCPVDFFPGSDKAADCAIALAEKFRGHLTLLHVVEPIATVAYTTPFDPTEYIKAMTLRSRAELKNMAMRAQAANVPVDVVVRTGDIDSEIQSLIKRRHVDFVVMGTHGRRGIEKFFLGSTTERLLRKLNVPLLTIGNFQSKRRPVEFRHILVATDFSDGTNDAIAYALSMAQNGCKVTLLHVLNDVDADISGRYRDQLIRSIRRELEELLPEEAQHSTHVTARVETGLPIHRILPILRKEKIDLIVMNVHRKTLFDRLSIGSTAEKVVRGAEAPVLVVPQMGARKYRRPTKANGWR